MHTITCNMQYINYTHRIKYCISYVLVFAFFAINFWRVRYDVKIKYLYPDQTKVKTGKDGLVINPLN